MLKMDRANGQMSDSNMFHTVRHYCYLCYHRAGPRSVSTQSLDTVVCEQFFYPDRISIVSFVAGQLALYINH